MLLTQLWLVIVIAMRYNMISCQLWATLCTCTQCGHCCHCVTRNVVVAAIGATWHERSLSPSCDEICLMLMSSLFVLAFERHDMKNEKLAANRCCCCSHFYCFCCHHVTQYENQHGMISSRDTKCSLCCHWCNVA